VVLLDVKMPGLDGFQAAAHMRSLARTRAAPIIFLTAFDTSFADARRAYDLGAFDYIARPFDADVVRHKVAGFVRLYEQAEQLRQQAVFIGVLKHDLRNPLNTIMTAGRLQRREPSTTKIGSLSIASPGRANGWKRSSATFSTSHVPSSPAAFPSRGNAQLSIESART
jgi:DNA-binding response OmpR family regulator